MRARMAMWLALALIAPLCSARADDVIPAPTVLEMVAQPAPPSSPERAGRFWAECSGLILRLDTGFLPSLVTTSAPDTPRAQAGLEGLPTTRVLFGNSNPNEGTRGGVQFRCGYMLECSRVGVDVGLLVVAGDTDQFTAASDGSQILARPYFSTQTASNSRNARELISFPGVVAGVVSARTDSDLRGVEVNFRCALAWLACDSEYSSNTANGNGYEIDFLIGYRGMRYHDSLAIEAVAPLTPATPSTNRLGVRDSFDVHNIFNGGQVGLTGRYRYRGLFVDGRGTLALGQRLARVQILGVTDLVQAAGITTVPGGLLASRTNIGFYRDEDIAFVTQMDLRAGYYLTENIRVTVGYTLLFMNNVVQAGGLIDVGVNPTQLPPGTLRDAKRPGLVFADDALWGHALSVGFEVRY